MSARRSPAVERSHRARRRVGFLSHELAEYAIGAALIAAGAHLNGGFAEEFFAIGSALLALNLVTRAKLGVFKLVGRGVHHLFDYLIIVLAAAAPLFGFVRHDVVAILTTELVALLLVFIEQSTHYRDLPAGPGSGRTVREARLVEDGAPSGRALPVLTHAARRAGFWTGFTKKIVRSTRSGWSEGASDRSDSR